MIDISEKINEKTILDIWGAEDEDEIRLFNYKKPGIYPFYFLEKFKKEEKPEFAIYIGLYDFIGGFHKGHLLYLDLDTDNTKEYLLILETRGIPPNIIVNTSHHISLLWRCEDTLKKEEIEDLSNTIAQFIDTVRPLNCKVCERRIPPHKVNLNNTFIRFPLTYNSKRKGEVRWLLEKKEYLSKDDIQKILKLKQKIKVLPVKEEGKKEQEKEEKGEKHKEQEIQEIQEIEMQKQEIKKEIKEEIKGEIEKEISNEEEKKVDIDKSEEEKLQRFKYCELFTFLWNNFPYHRYEGWRLTSYFAVLAGLEKEFLEKSKDWKGEVKQTPEDRLKYSREELKEGKDDFWFCRTLFDKLPELKLCDNLQYNPCQSCKRRNLSLKPYQEISDFIYNIEDYTYKIGILKKGDKVIIEDFYILDVVKFSTEKGEIKITLKKGNSIHSYLYPSELEYMCKILTPLSPSDFKKYIEKFLFYQDGLGKIEIVEPFTGFEYETKKWNILGIHYLKPIITERQDANTKGNKNEWEKLIRKSILLEDWELNFIIAFFLTSLFPHEEPIIPALLITGDTGSGKTTRCEIANSLFRHPLGFFQWRSATIPYISEKVQYLRIPIVFDEFFWGEGEEKERENLLYQLTNKQGRYTKMYQTKDNYAPAIFISETQNFSSFWGGLQRRFIILKITNFKQELREIANNLRKHYGFLYQYEINEDKYNINYEFNFYDHKITLEKMISAFYQFQQKLSLNIEIEKIAQEFLRLYISSNSHHTPVSKTAEDVKSFIDFLIIEYKGKLPEKTYISRIIQEFSKRYMKRVDENIIKYIVSDKIYVNKVGDMAYPKCLFTSQNPLLKFYWSSNKEDEIFALLQWKKQVEENISQLPEEQKNKILKIFNEIYEEFKIQVEKENKEKEEKGGDEK